MKAFYFLLALGFAACTQSGNVKNSDESYSDFAQPLSELASEETPQLQKLGLELSPRKFKLADHDFLEAIVTNSGQDTLMMGQEYYFDYLDEGQWVRVDLSRDKRGNATVSNSLRQELLPGQQIVEKCALWKDVHTYQPGTYRVMIPVYAEDKNVTWLATEFQIE